jgi:hypothetical protein
MRKQTKKKLQSMENKQFDMRNKKKLLQREEKKQFEN